MVERLRIAITGHRLNQLPQASLPALESALRDCLARIGASARDAGHGYARLALVSGLAEGADRVAALAALALGWRLHAELPFKQARYERDFAEVGSVAEFRSLMRRAQRVTAHDGEAHQTGPDDPSAYARLGESLAKGADLIVAVWNGAPPKGPGGTADVCALALDAGKPIVWISPDGARSQLIVAPKRPNAHSFRFRLRAALETRFGMVARPPEMRRA